MSGAAGASGWTPCPSPTPRSGHSLCTHTHSKVWHSLVFLLLWTVFCYIFLIIFVYFFVLHCFSFPSLNTLSLYCKQKNMHMQPQFWQPKHSSLDCNHSCHPQIPAKRIVMFSQSCLLCHPYVDLESYTMHFVKWEIRAHYHLTL